MKKREYFGVGSLLVATFLYGFFGILTRMLGFSLPVFFAAWTRGLVSCVILAIPLFGFGLWRQVQSRDWQWFVVRSVGGFFGFFGSFISFYYIPIGTAYFIFYCGVTVSGYILGRILFGERVTKLRLWSLVLALFGLSLIYAQSLSGGNMLYMSAAFVSGLGTGLWNVSSKKISGSYSDIQLNFIDFLLQGFVFVFALSLLFHEQWVMPKLDTAWIANLLFVVMFLSTGQLVVYGFKRLDAQIGSLIMLMEVLFGAFLAYLFYKETPTPYALAGGLLILTAIILPEINWKKVKL